MQRTADFPHTLAAARLPQAADVVDDATALDAAVDVLETHAPPRKAPMPRVLRARESPASRLPGWHDDVHLIAWARPEAQILAPPRGEWTWWVVPPLPPLWPRPLRCAEPTP